MLSAIASFLGLLGSLFSWFTGAQQRKIGAETQALKDDQATITEARQAETARDSAATDNPYADKLRERYTDHS